MSVHQEMDLELEYRLSANFKILGDSQRLSGALVNLLSNAVEAIRDIGNTYKGKIRFSSYVQNNEFIFKIYNDGPEIPKDIIDNIFKPLFTHGKASGTGLGLASVTKTINEHQGTIKVENILGGVEFTLNLKTGTETDDFNIYGFQLSSKSYDYTSSKANAGVDISDLRILLLENDFGSIKHYEQVIRELPYKVKLEIAKNLESAKESICRSRFDLYLLNISS
jgi:hypothetical protein